MMKILRQFFNSAINDAFVVGCCAFLFLAYAVISFCTGIHDANNPEECKARSLFDIVKSPIYTVGCNLGKDRFDIKLN